MSAPTPFTFPSYRRLCQYLGETDAMVELMELAARTFLNAAHESGDPAAYVAASSAIHGIQVNLAEVDLLSIHIARNYIVTVYHAAERFLHEFRRDHLAIYQVDWKDQMGEDPLTIALKHIVPNLADVQNLIGYDLIMRFQYYRLVRNWVVHSKDLDMSELRRKYHEFGPYSASNQAVLGELKAPNPPESLTFDDFILFSRITKMIAEKIGQAAMSIPRDWSRLLTPEAAKRFKRLSKNPERMKNAIAGRVKTTYGFDDPTASWVAEELLTSWRNG